MSEVRLAQQREASGEPHRADFELILLTSVLLDGYERIHSLHGTVQKPTLESGLYRRTGFGLDPGAQWREHRHLHSPHSHVPSTLTSFVSGEKTGRSGKSHILQAELP